MPNPYTGPAMTLDNVRALGVRSIDVTCRCGQEATIDVSDLWRFRLVWQAKPSQYEPELAAIWGISGYNKSDKSGRPRRSQSKRAQAGKLVKAAVVDDIARTHHQSCGDKVNSPPYSLPLVSVIIVNYNYGRFF